MYAFSKDMDSSNFYEDLEVYPSLEELIASGGESPLPADWWIVISDIIGSTKAVSRGEYREVVTLGASTIIAAVNTLEGIEVPFAFGGDGSVLAVPEACVESVLQGLGLLQKRAEQGLNLSLRCGAVRVSTLRDKGYETLVGRYQRSEHNDLAIFSGGGIGFADKVIKGYEPGEFKEPHDVSGADPQLDGLECRWEPVRSGRGKFASLIVVPCGETHIRCNEIMGTVFLLIDSIYDSVKVSRPVELPELRLSFARKHIRSEMLLRARPNSIYGRVCYYLHLIGQIALGKFLMAVNFPFNDFRWGDYPLELIKNIDNQNFADIYSHVIPGSLEQHKKVREELESMQSRGEIEFGMHLSDYALFTCHVTQYTGRHLHFLDGGDGGLTLAAQEMKSKR